MPLVIADGGLGFTALIGMLLTTIALVAHRFLPQRRLVLNGPAANYYLTQHDDHKKSQVQWVDYPRFPYTCQPAIFRIAHQRHRHRCRSLQANQ